MHYDLEFEAGIIDLLRTFGKNRPLEVIHNNLVLDSYVCHPKCEYVEHILNFKNLCKSSESCTIAIY